MRATLGITLSLVLAGCVLVGCGGSSGPTLARATGLVTYNGQPVAGATVTFLPESGPLSTGITDADGHFTLATGGRPGATIGRAKVTVTKFSDAQKDVSQLKPEDMKTMQQSGKAIEDLVGKSALPARYADPKTSQLAADVSADESANVFQLHLWD